MRPPKAAYRLLREKSQFDIQVQVQCTVGQNYIPQELRFNIHTRRTAQVTMQSAINYNKGDNAINRHIVQI